MCAGVCVRDRVCACGAVCISCACRRGICRSIYLYICLSKCPLWRAFALCALSRFISVFSTLFFAPLRFRFCFSYFSFCSSSHSSLSAVRIGRGQQMTYPHKPRHTHTCAPPSCCHCMIITPGVASINKSEVNFAMCLARKCLVNRAMAMGQQRQRETAGRTVRETDSRTACNIVVFRANSDLLQFIQDTNLPEQEALYGYPQPSPPLPTPSPPSRRQKEALSAACWQRTLELEPISAQALGLRLMADSLDSWAFTFHHGRGRGA